MNNYKMQIFFPSPLDKALVGQGRQKKVAIGLAKENGTQSMPEVFACLIVFIAMMYIIQHLIAKCISARHWIVGSGSGLAAIVVSRIYSWLYVCPSRLWNAIKFLVKITHVLVQIVRFSQPRARV
jgi:hypothetical protein